MHSEAAAGLLAELTSILGGKLCVACASSPLYLEAEGVLESMRELVATRHVMLGQFRCSLCRGLALVAFRHRFGYIRPSV